MSNLFEQKQDIDLFAGISQDENIDLSQFIRKPNDNAESASIKQPESIIDSLKHNETPSQNAVAVKSLSPLERELEKQRTQQLGMSMTREEFEAGKERTEFKSPAESDERLHSMEQAQDDAEFLLKQRAAIIPLKQCESGPEYTQMVHEISLVRFDETGKAYFEYDKDDEGRIIPVVMVRLRTETDPPYSRENDYLQMQRDNINRERVANGQQPLSNDAPINDTISDDDEDDDETISESKKKTVQFIIDKTGLGADFALTEEERAKLVEANEIRLTQVEVLDIASITTVKPERESFAGKIHEYSLSGSKTTISFPASGFKADMTGLTYGEIGDISLSMDSVTVDKYYKRLAIIYNKMKNISSGPFESFESFLKNIAYTDISLAVYGLYVSTFPEVQSISLRCGRNTCSKTFDWNFSTRNVLQLQKSDEVFLDHLKELAAADPDQYDDIYKKAPVRNIKYIKLPKCGYIVGLGIASAWEFLYNFIPVLDEKTFKDAFGDDLNQVYMNNILLLTTVLSVRVPDPKNPGTYILCEGYKDILDAIYNINPEEIKILAAISAKIQREYQVYFSFGDVVCPHCKNVTKDLELTIDDLVFQTYQRLLSTEIDLTNIRGL
jgi:hypothetical protein